MKKIYTLAALAVFSLTAGAQTDMSSEFTAYTGGSTIDDSPMDGTISIVNVGADIAMGDTIYFSYIIDGDIYSLNLDAGFVNYYVTEEVFATGDELLFGNPALAWAELGITVELCSAVYGIGFASVDVTFPTDSDATDNSECISYELPVDASGVEELGLEVGNVFVAAGQLMIVNNGIGSGAQANINIVNMNGQVAQNETITLVAGTSTMEVSSLATGIYVVSIQVNGAVINRKISIQ
jgi:hypothetical protein